MERWRDILGRHSLPDAWAKFEDRFLTDIQEIVQLKEAERRRLRALPWLEKLEMLDQFPVRHLAIRQTHPRKAKALDTAK